MSQTLASWIPTAIVLLLGWLLPKYIEKRVTEAARGAVDLTVGRSLANHRLELDKQLETFRHELTTGIEGLRQSLALDRERYSRDYGLFATKRNEVYAETFALLEKSRGRFHAKFAKLISYTDFSRAPEVDLLNLATRLELISASERQELRERVEAGDLDRARKLAGELNERDEFRRANNTFFELKSAVVLNSLYFSQSVDPLLSQVIQALGMLSVYADEAIAGEGYPRRDAYTEVEKVDALTASIREAMRAEMQASFRSRFPEDSDRGV